MDESYMYLEKGSLQVVLSHLLSSNRPTDLQELEQIIEAIEHQVQNCLNLLEGGANL